jgi:hypothetical protein
MNKTPIIIMVIIAIIVLCCCSLCALLWTGYAWQRSQEPYRYHESRVEGEGSPLRASEADDQVSRASRGTQRAQSTQSTQDVVRAQGKQSTQDVKAGNWSKRPRRWQDG